MNGDDLEWDPAVWRRILPDANVYLSRDDRRPCSCRTTRFILFRSDGPPPDGRTFVRVACQKCPRVNQPKPAVFTGDKPAKLVRSREVAVGTYDVETDRIVLKDD